MNLKRLEVEIISTYGIKMRLQVVVCFLGQCVDFLVFYQT